jgi:hypothetical protein
MWRVEREHIDTIPRQSWLTILNGKQWPCRGLPAVFPPSCVLVRSHHLFLLYASNSPLYPSDLAAYGEYNNLVREAAGIRNQSLVLWDFECVHPFLESNSLLPRLPE